jgi:5-methyltetrahydrofolate--homocysteine methyltransferase
VVGIFPASSIDEDVQVFHDASRTKQLATLSFLREQRSKSNAQPNLCLSDFVAPHDSGCDDWIGAFAVTAGHGLTGHVAKLEAEHDDYQAIIAKALADRLAEALAERIHQRVRQEVWGYAPAEQCSNDALIAEEYRGIRPAPGYPACPEHNQKEIIWSMLDVEKHTGMQLTESFAMWPAASVSGFYLSHPESRYFALGKVARDQVESFSRRQGISFSEAERRLQPNLGYSANAA